MTSTLVRRVFFQCVHRYARADWSETQNREVFGLCFNPDGHGHNYTLDAFVEGPIDAKTGMVINLRDLDLIMNAAIEPLNGHHVNLEVPEFKELIPTTENLAKYIFVRIQTALNNSTATLKRIRLYESDDLWVDYIP